MLHIHFFVGLGVGAFIATLLFVALLMIVIGYQKRTSKANDAYTEETIRLMKERNDTEKEVARHLASVAEWTEKNFNAFTR